MVFHNFGANMDNLKGDKRMDLIVLGLVILASFLGAFAQILLKKGVNMIGASSLLNMTKNFVGYLFTNPLIFSGVAIYAISMIIYLTALSRGEVSVVYPIISVSYILAAILSVFFLGEKLSLLRWLGIIIIVIGVSLVVRY